MCLLLFARVSRESGQSTNLVCCLRDVHGRVQVAQLVLSLASVRSFSCQDHPKAMHNHICKSSGIARLRSQLLLPRPPQRNSQPHLQIFRDYSAPFAASPAKTTPKQCTTLLANLSGSLGSVRNFSCPPKARIYSGFGHRRLARALPCEFEVTTNCSNFWVAYGETLEQNPSLQLPDLLRNHFWDGLPNYRAEGPLRAFW